MAKVAALEKIERQLSSLNVDVMDEENSDASLSSDGDDSNVVVSDKETSISTSNDLRTIEGIRLNQESRHIGVKLCVYKDFLKADLAFSHSKITTVSQD